MGFGGGPINYKVIDGNFPPGITLDAQTGYLYGVVPEMDDWVDEFYNAIPEYTNENYATVGSASLFDQGTTSHYPTHYQSTFTVRAYNSYNEESYIDGVFFFRLMNNWSSDRDRFIKNYDTQHFIDGLPVDNLTYLEEMKTRGYFD